MPRSIPKKKGESNERDRSIAPITCSRHGSTCRQDGFLDLGRTSWLCSYKKVLWQSCGYSDFRLDCTNIWNGFSSEPCFQPVGFPSPVKTAPRPEPSCAKTPKYGRPGTVPSASNPRLVKGRLNTGFHSPSEGDSCGAWSVHPCSPW